MNEAVQEIRSAGGAAAAVALDLRDADAGARVVDFALKTFGSIDILVNNAGATRRGEFAVNVTDSRAYPLSGVATRVTVTQLERFALAGRCA